MAISASIEDSGTLVVPTELSQDELKTRLVELTPWGGWRHQFHFSNGFKISDIEQCKPWTE